MEDNADIRGPTYFMFQENKISKADSVTDSDSGGDESSGEETKSSQGSSSTEEYSSLEYQEDDDESESDSNSEIRNMPKSQRGKNKPEKDVSAQESDENESEWETDTESETNSETQILSEKEFVIITDENETEQSEEIVTETNLETPIGKNHEVKLNAEKYAITKTESKIPYDNDKDPEIEDQSEHKLFIQEKIEGESSNTCNDESQQQSDTYTNRKLESDTDNMLNAAEKDRANTGNAQSEENNKQTYDNNNEIGKPCEEDASQTKSEVQEQTDHKNADEIRAKSLLSDKERKEFGISNDMEQYSKFDAEMKTQAVNSIASSDKDTEDILPEIKLTRDNQTSCTACSDEDQYTTLYAYSKDEQAISENEKQRANITNQKEENELCKNKGNKCSDVTHHSEENEEIQSKNIMDDTAKVESDVPLIYENDRNNTKIIEMSQPLKSASLDTKLEVIELKTTDIDDAIELKTTDVGEAINNVLLPDLADEFVDLQKSNPEKSHLCENEMEHPREILCATTSTEKVDLEEKPGDICNVLEQKTETCDVEDSSLHSTELNIAGIEVKMKDIGDKRGSEVNNKYDKISEFSKDNKVGLEETQDHRMDSKSLRLQQGIQRQANYKQTVLSISSKEHIVNKHSKDLVKIENHFDSKQKTNGEEQYKEGGEDQIKDYRGEEISSVEEYVSRGMRRARALVKSQEKIFSTLATARQVFSNLETEIIMVQRRYLPQWKEFLPIIRASSRRRDRAILERTSLMTD